MPTIPITTETRPGGFQTVEIDIRDHGANMTTRLAPRDPPYEFKPNCTIMDGANCYHSANKNLCNQYAAAGEEINKLAPDLQRGIREAIALKGPDPSCAVDQQQTVPVQIQVQEFDCWGWLWYFILLIIKYFLIGFVILVAVSAVVAIIQCVVDSVKQARKVRKENQQQTAQELDNVESVTTTDNITPARQETTQGNVVYEAVPPYESLNE